MKTDFHLRMAEATRLTREGRLTNAVDIIQSLLGARSGKAPAATPPAHAIIDLIPVEIAKSKVGGEPKKEPTPARRSAPARGSFLRKSFSAGSVNLPYWLYVPARETKDLPLVVMLHGCTQSGEDFARGTRMNELAAELGFVVAYPEQISAANAQKCWNWFRPGDQQRDRGEPAAIAGLTREIVADLDLDAGRVFVAGLSAGGAAAAIMSATYPDLYSAAGIHSGLACGSARDLPSALMAMNGRGASAPARGHRFVPVITFHGDRDPTVQEVNSRRIISEATAALSEAVTTEVQKAAPSSRHAYTREVSKNSDGRVVIEQWTIHGAGHAWGGGDPSGSYTDPKGPDASREMVRFFLASGR